MSHNWLLGRMSEWQERDAVVGMGVQTTYEELLDGVSSWRERLTEWGITSPGRVVAFSGDYSAASVSLLLTLLDRSCVMMPFASSDESQLSAFLKIAEAEFLIESDDPASPRVRRLSSEPVNELILQLAEHEHPGLVLFTSGSTGEPKAVLHDLDRLLEKFRQRRQTSRMLSFLLLDHIGGVNTLFYALANGGTAIITRDRQPETVCATIEHCGVEILPTTPTFLNLLLLSGEHRRHDLSSLRLITYGTEVMPAHTLARIRDAFPNVRLQQTYGLSEIGILRSKSREDGSLWVKVGGEGFETQVRDGVLWIRAHSSMAGYLNAPSPFDEEGWLNTEDAVEEDGEWLRFLGRTTDIINVGGQKVYPAAVESVLLGMENVEDVTVRGERNPLTGEYVVARFNLLRTEAPAELKARVWRHCKGRLEPFMIPVKVEIVDEAQFNVRFKHLRSDTP